MPGPAFSFRNVKIVFFEIVKGIGHGLFPFFIATVISADRPSLGQIKPGDGIQFGAVSLDEAYLVLQEMEDRINDFKRKIN